MTLITLSVKFMLESIVKLETFTTPVPPGVKLISAFELEAIMLSLNVKLSIVVVPANDDAPDTVIVPNVANPLVSRVPVVVRFSLTKLISPDESVIEPSAKVRFPITDPVSAESVPVVVMFSSPKLMAPDESVIEPLASVIVPIPEPVVLPIVPETVTLPVVVSEPSTIKFSLMFTMDESIAVIELPHIPIPSPTKDPDPLALNIRSSFDLVPSMLLSLILIAGNSMAPVPDGFSTRSAFDCVVLISFSTNPIDVCANGVAYNSVKLEFILMPAVLMLSPVIATERVEALTGLMTMFYTGQAAVVAAFMGASAYVRTRERSDEI